MSKNPGTPGSGKAFDSQNNIINWIDRIESFIKIFNANSGANGAVVIDDTNLHTPPAGYCYFCLEAVEDVAVINDAAGNMTNIAGLELSENGRAYGEFTNARLTSGKVIAYLKEL